MRDPGNLDETVSGVRDGDLVDLLARVARATGADRELDEAIALALCDEHRFMQLAGAPAGLGCEMYRFGTHGFHSALRVTASLDASLGLVERVLPGWSWSVIHNREKRDRAAELVPPDWPVHGAVYGRGPTPALALLSALLKALIAQAADTSARNVPAGEGQKQEPSSSCASPSPPVAARHGSDANAEPSGKED